MQCVIIQCRVAVLLNFSLYTTISVQSPYTMYYVSALLLLYDAHNTMIIIILGDKSKSAT